MHAKIDIELSELAFSVLSNQASAVGKSPAELAAAVVESVYGVTQAAADDAISARAQFDACLGSVDLGQPIGVTNEAIDSDLAREYTAAAGSV